MGFLFILIWKVLLPLYTIGVVLFTILWSRDLLNEDPERTNDDIMQRLGLIAIWPVTLTSKRREELWETNN